MANTSQAGNRDSVNGVNESTHLLPGDDEEAVSGSPSPNAKPSPSPLPKVQLGALIAVRIVDPIAYQQIFPYINQLLADLRIAEPEQVFSVDPHVLCRIWRNVVQTIGECLLARTDYFSISVGENFSGQDVVGRRPVVFTGLLGIAVTTMTFGLSTSFVGILTSRFFGGLVAGNVAVIHSILAEITDDTNQDFAVPVYSLAWPVGTVIGPLIGGTLANAATRYPEYFSWPLFVEHPYLPPCLVSATCTIIGAGLGYTLIQETLPSKRSAELTSSAAVSHSGVNSDDAEPPNMMALLSVPAIRALTISGFALSSLSLAFDVVFTLFCYTPVDAGGLGLDPSAIGNVFAFAGMFAVFLRLFAMPFILRRFDYAKTYNTCMYIWPFLFGFLPCLNILARAESHLSPKATVSTSKSLSALIWTGLLTLLALSKVGAIPHSLSLLLIKRHAPSPGALGRSNGLVQFAMCIGRTVGPIVVSSLFTGVNGISWVRRWGVGWIWAVGMVCGAVGGARVTSAIGS